MQMFRERLDAMTPEVMVREFVQGRVRGCRGKVQDEGGGEQEGPKSDFSTRALGHPIFSLEYAMSRDREMGRRGWDDEGT